MKLKRIISSICAISLSLTISAQQPTQKDKLILIDGYFFNEMPIAKSEIKGMQFISTPNGVTAIELKVENPLPESALKLAIPVEQVPEGAELLKRASQSQAKTLAISVKKAESIEIGSNFPQFTAHDIDGKTWTSDDIVGKPMVLNLWFSGCGPCRSEMPELSQWKDEMPDVMFFSATYEDAETARPVIDKQGFNWIALVDDKQFVAMMGEQGYPMTIVINKEGVISHVEYGTSPTQREELKKKIEEIR